jgi:hypothetical protein
VILLKFHTYRNDESWRKQWFQVLKVTAAALPLVHHYYWQVNSAVIFTEYCRLIVPTQLGYTDGLRFWNPPNQAAQTNANQYCQLWGPPKYKHVIYASVLVWDKAITLKRRESWSSERSWELVPARLQTMNKHIMTWNFVPYPRLRVKELTTPVWLLLKRCIMSSNSCWLHVKSCAVDTLSRSCKVSRPLPLSAHWR